MRRPWVAVCLGLATIAATPSMAQDRDHPFSIYARPVRLVDLPDGRKMNLRCVGQGAPIIVLEAGLGFPSLSWRKVQTPLAQSTRVCAYDRAGIGFSDPATGPRTPATSATDLLELMTAAGERGPYLLVGSSYGGLVVTAFAERFPDRVAGLVLVDPAEPGQDIALAKIVPAMTDELAALDAADQACLDRMQRGGATFPDMVAAGCASEIDPVYPADLRATLERQSLSVDQAKAAMSENQALRAIAGDAAAPSALADDPPLIVLTAGAAFATDDYSADQQARLSTAWRSLHQRTAARSSRGEERRIEGAGHVIQASRPEAVITAVQDLLARSR